MFCYQWTANNCQGIGSKVLKLELDQIIDKDIREATGIIREFVANQMHHNQESVQVIYTNIIRLSQCTEDEYFDKKPLTKRGFFYASNRSSVGG